ncbi:MAG: heterodisulfide reductase-related iron-sulfur binding cluster, partial [Desulfomonilaceae bacterium]
SPQNVVKTYRYLMERLRGGVGLMLRCCGVPADWAGRKDDFSRSLSEFIREWERMDRPHVITACSSCYSLFKTHLPEIKLVSLWETIESCGLPDLACKTHQMAIAIHDPCSSRHEPQVHEAVRNILKSLNCEIHELALSRGLTECCGYGGLMCFANRDLAINVMNRRVNESPDDFVAYCAVCQDHFRSQGKTTWHLLDLIFGNRDVSNVVGKPLDYSQIRENRSCLRKSLLENLWDEPVDKVQEHETMKLYMTQEIKDVIAQRMILNDDIKLVIEHAERSGAKFVNRSTGHYLAHFTPAKVTYWVEYAPSEGGFSVHNPYSHRMQIIEESKF